MSLPFSKAEVAEIINTQGADTLTAKRVRELLEEKLGKESGELKPYKADISDLIDEVMKVRRRRQRPASPSRACQCRLSRAAVTDAA